MPRRAKRSRVHHGASVCAYAAGCRQKHCLVVHPAYRDVCLAVRSEAVFITARACVLMPQDAGRSTV
ncbi:MAG: hypothetical protein AB7E48_03045 [Deferribacterales bacterium]